MKDRDVLKNAILISAIMRCEFIARQLPGIRAAVAKEMAGSGMTQEEIAKAMGISQGAVSQYLSRQRGIRLDPRISPLVKDICRRISSENSSIEKEICGICKNL